MDWLTKFNGMIDCARRAVQLTNREGTSIEFVAIIPSAGECALNSLKGVPMEAINVVCEYPDVFPNDLPGMPSD